MLKEGFCIKKDKVIVIDHHDYDYDFVLFNTKPLF